MSDEEKPSGSSLYRGPSGDKRDKRERTRDIAKMPVRGAAIRASARIRLHGHRVMSPIRRNVRNAQSAHHVTNVCRVVNTSLRVSIPTNNTKRRHARHASSACMA